jgi:hypothetical protein
LGDHNETHVQRKRKKKGKGKIKLLIKKETPETITPFIACSLVDSPIAEDDR